MSKHCPVCGERMGTGCDQLPLILNCGHACCAACMEASKAMAVLICNVCRVEVTGVRVGRGLGVWCEGFVVGGVGFGVVGGQGSVVCALLCVFARVLSVMCDCVCTVCVPACV